MEIGKFVHLNVESYLLSNPCSTLMSRVMGRPSTAEIPLRGFLVSTMQIPITNRKGEVVAHAIVDAEDFDSLNCFDWRLNGPATHPYACRTYTENGEKHIVLMHRQIMQTPPGMHTDHINHNTLDNRRSNLRACTPQENLFNRQANRNSSSRFVGVAKERGGTWRAQIQKNEECFWLGSYLYEEDAALAYDRAAEVLFGEFAGLNLPGRNDQPSNRVCKAKASSGFYGVRRRKDRWQATISINGRMYNIGSFDDPVEAAKAYDAKAIELGRNDRYLNFPASPKRHA